MRGPVPEGALKIGAAVRIAFNPVTPEITLPVFVPDKG